MTPCATPATPCRRWWWRSIMCGGSTALFIYGGARAWACLGSALLGAMACLGSPLMTAVRRQLPPSDRLVLGATHPSPPPPSPCPPLRSLLLLLLLRAVGHERPDAGLLLFWLHAHGLLRCVLLRMAGWLLVCLLLRRAYQRQHVLLLR